MHKLIIPYYGALWRSGFGQEQCFFVVAVKNIGGLVEKIEMRVASGRTPQSLSRGLSEMKIDGVLCADARLAEYADCLDAEGIWVCWEMSGDLGDLVSAWWGGSRASATIDNNYQAVGGLL